MARPLHGTLKFRAYSLWRAEKVQANSNWENRITHSIRRLDARTKCAATMREPSSLRPLRRPLRLLKRLQLLPVQVMSRLWIVFNGIYRSDYDNFVTDYYWSDYNDYHYRWGVGNCEINRPIRHTVASNLETPTTTQQPTTTSSDAELAHALECTDNVETVKCEKAEFCYEYLSSYFRYCDESRLCPKVRERRPVIYIYVSFRTCFFMIARIRNFIVNCIVMSFFRRAFMAPCTVSSQNSTTHLGAQQRLPQLPQLPPLPKLLLLQQQVQKYFSLIIIHSA